MRIGANILIVAPDPDFRQSLGFVLEAEGCEVHLTGRLPAEADPAAAYDCTIVDDKSLPKRPERCIERLPRPLIILVNRLPAMSSDDSVRLVEKPILGNGLIDTVRASLHAATNKPTA